jgi:starvation-inducible outer membrane lipoprotein
LRPVIKQIATTGILVFLIAFLLAACTSITEETLSEPSSSQSGAVVPGEKAADEERYAPGPMGSGNVRW